MSFFTKIEYFFENAVVLAAISSFLFAQFVKLVITVVRHSRKSLRELLLVFFWKTGGMPSSHAATVSSITTSVGIMEGVTSNLFIVTLFFALVVLRDAVGVRHASGMQAKSLNSLGRSVQTRFGIDYHTVKEVHGHKPLEVLVGCFLGFFISAAYGYL
ncbi:MAG: divergent PAP2 family protein [Termitinemataceae bacterium]|nr:MAG: divergent PAP2 family protein [Termitinemataceae bacterium]